jgi:uncharacterized protein (DUF1778 family)
MSRTADLGPGRARDSYIRVRCTVGEKRAWSVAARKSGKTLSEWVRDVIARRAEYSLGEYPFESQGGGIEL